MSDNSQVKLLFKSRKDNVSLARQLVAALVLRDDPSVAELEEIKLAVSEAVSNAIIHGYGNREYGEIELLLSLQDNLLRISVRDWGRGIADIKQAMAISYSTEEDRMGLGFAFMQAFMDDLEVTSAVGKGTTVTMSKKLAAAETVDEAGNRGCL